MGFNTVAFVLNDLAREIEQCPHQVAFLLANAHYSDSVADQQRLRYYLDVVARKNNEPPLHRQALKVMPYFHASDPQYYRAGGNCIESLKFVRYGKTKEGKNTITLELPEWWDKKRHQ